ncbi:MAG TPA: type 1 glutamine amidotransferase domain-containing protein [Candidatus Dormibacteraeota bacterium]|nr:type 1 glutamine amidotransferase domain-containing protein [Candidatus Dormibacteraeota bacterium]
MAMRIACLLDNGFEDSEFKKPYDAFTQAGHQVVVIGHEAGKELKGYRGQVTVTSEKGIDEVSPDTFDALFIPGGYSPDHLRINPKVVQFTRAFFDANKPVFAVCHGPQLLITADVVKGRRMTAWPTIQDDLRKVGADVVDAEVVVDGNLVTSRKPDDLDAFVRESLKLLEKQPAAAR